jgi:hypothetical protein
MPQYKPTSQLKIPYYNNNSKRERHQWLLLKIKNFTEQSSNNFDFSGIKRANIVKPNPYLKL